MPVQRFEPMTKDFATFDCDAHVTEPPVIWERAHEYLSDDELQALKTTIWFDSDSKQLIVNGKAGVGIGSQRLGGVPGDAARAHVRRSGDEARRPARLQRAQPQPGYGDGL